MKTNGERQEELEKEREHQIHTQNITQPVNDDENPKTLEYLAEIDDVAELPEEGLKQFTSRLASTANLSEEEVRGNEWVKEYIAQIWQSNFPPEYGLTGHVRAWAYDNPDEFRLPLTAQDKVAMEGYLDNTKLALSRSKDFEGVETATKDTRESIVRGNESDSGGGLIDRLRN